MHSAQYARALRRERAGYVNRGQGDRVAAVDVELAKLGVKAEDRPSLPPAPQPQPAGPETADVQPPPERATPERPRRRG